jgi:hypothetical protein
MQSPYFFMAAIGLIFFMLIMMYSMALQRRAVDAQGRGMSGIEASVAMQRESFEMQRQSFEMQKQILELSRESVGLHRKATELLEQVLAKLKDSR